MHGGKNSHGEVVKRAAKAQIEAIARFKNGRGKGTGWFFGVHDHGYLLLKLSYQEAPMPNLVLFFIIILIAFLTGSEGHAQTKVKVGFTAMTARMAPMWVAQDQRFFTKYGIDPEVIFVRSSPTALAAMMAGEVQIGGAGGTAVLGATVGGTDLWKRSW
ncbi:MAG: ABC transporter substrate-binding protein [Deltaproteobacteria bacterium]|nr:ABC transporter substrate-binding protein [Deltaproteobacteria bacterium]